MEPKIDRLLRSRARRWRPLLLMAIRGSSLFALTTAHLPHIHRDAHRFNTVLFSGREKAVAFEKIIKNFVVSVFALYGKISSGWCMH